MDKIHSKMHYMPTTAEHSLPFQQLCELQIQAAAAKSLQGILYNESMIKLLDYKAPSRDVVVAGGGVDKSGLAVAVREVLKCLITRAIKPSPLKVALRPMEMERVYSIVSFECLGAVSECKDINFVSLTHILTHTQTHTHTHTLSLSLSLSRYEQ